jgi:glycosyltransferase involved in cell wall biosynthesis
MLNRKILYLANIRMPTEKAHGAQIVKTCEAFANRGIDVELVIPGRKTPIKESPFVYYGAKDNFRITIISTPDLVRFGKIGFGLSALIFSECARWHKNFWQADVIYSRDAFVLLQYLLLGRTLVYEAHTKPTAISAFVARRVYKLIVISEGLRDVYEKLGVPSRNIAVAHDAVDPAPFEKYYDQKESRTWLGILLDKKVVMYVGKIDSVKGADTFAQAGDNKSADAVFVAIGNGPLKKELSQKYPKTSFLPETRYSELPRVLAAADVLVIPNSAKDIDASTYTSPMKAFAYMAAEKPIVVADVPSLREIFGEDTACYFVPDDAADLARKVSHVLSDSRYANMLAHNARKQANRRSWSNRASNILKSIV